ncbi:MAG: hypothetical protein MJ097_04125 [Dorea sp.]|nr:hypothetical protein [Dorea sp.]
MFEGLQVELKAVKTILADGEVDKQTHVCTIQKYDEAREYFLLRVDAEETNHYNLDNLYQCRMKTESGDLYCYGMVKERFWQNDGGALKFSIQNGFYKSLTIY